ncbi:MAG: hypothetical protein PHQ34_08755 [Methanothrix sp.]|nr:hypothetical protein [Methanothrix sp.]
MDKKDFIWIILISVIAVIVISFAIPILVKMPHPASEQNPVPSQEQHQTQRPAAPPGQEETKQLKTLISFINIGLIIPLFTIYTRIYRRLHSSFTLGLMAVVFAFGMYAITSNPLLVSLLGGRAEYIGFFQIIPDLCTTAALIILVRISLE